MPCWKTLGQVSKMKVLFQIYLVATNFHITTSRALEAGDVKLRTCSPDAELRIETDTQ